jgi:DNA replication and repair protein RecF
MIRVINLTNFRSYGNTKVSLDPWLNIIVGPNASGKTNLLEALYVFSETKSYRAKDQYITKHGKSYFRIEGNIDKNQTQKALAYSSTASTQKTFYENGVQTQKAKYKQGIRAVLFQPNDLLVLFGPPVLRRHAINSVLSKARKKYLVEYTEFKNVLSQRNALLKTSSFEAVRNQIFAWDIRFVELGNKIVEDRLDVINFFNEHLTTTYRKISGDNSIIEVEYKSLVRIENYAEELLSMLTKNLRRDFVLGATSVGPHRDDITFKINGHNFNQSGSRGEERTLMLALKLLELRYVKEGSGITPIFLLDDVTSELDFDRQSNLLNELQNIQTVITTTSVENILPDILDKYKIIKL